MYCFQRVCLQVAVHSFMRFSRQAFVCVLFCSFVAAAPMWIQDAQERDKLVHDRIEANLRKVHAAGDWQATDMALGKLWLQMACDYAEEEDSQRSEDAYSRALRLFQKSSSQREYAYTLDGLGLLYHHVGRLKEAENLFRKSLSVFEETHSEIGVRQLHVDLATLLLHERRFAGAEEESAKVIAEFQEQKEPDQSDLIAALITSSYAKCFQGRCEEGQREAERARIMANEMPSKNSLETVASLLAVGFEEWKNGSEAEGDRSMREAVTLIREKNDMTSATLLDAQLRVLSEYSDYLRQTHQKDKARQIDDEVSRLKETQKPDCRNCTVSVMGLTASQGRR
jgi:tetratricopeptide (TPR) repeat protein